jgi:hypothetical protein
MAFQKMPFSKIDRRYSGQEQVCHPEYRVAEKLVGPRVLLFIPEEGVEYHQR